MPPARRTRVLLPLALCLGLLGACAAGTAGAEAAPLRGTTWVWVPLQGPLPAAAAPSARVAQLRLDPQEARVTGHTGCNRLTGSFTLDGAALRFGQAATTRMACVAEGDLEPQFLKAFDAVRGWRVQGRVLWLLAEDGQPVMRLQAAP
jgi:heat shock protein HslJ